MEILVGTSGWSNPTWNPNGLSWYQEYSKLNTVELAMSFYHLPSAEQISLWAKEGALLTWTVKVDRAITHFYCFSRLALERYQEFKARFSELDSRITYYLFQLSPHALPDVRPKIEFFFKETGLQDRFALEWRNSEWLSKEHVQWASELGITIVSSDCSSVPADIICTSGTVYLRLHGQSDWFEHHYSRKELSRLACLVQRTDCDRVIVILDNDSSQLRNAKTMLSILKEGNQGE